MVLWGAATSKPPADHFTVVARQVQGNPEMIALRKPRYWTAVLLATCLLSAVGWSALWTYEPTRSLLPWLVVITAILCVVAWLREWKGSRVAALSFLGIWIAANWWFVEGLALFASFSIFGFV